MNELNLNLIKVLYLRFSSIYGDKFFKNHTTEKIIEIWWNEWMLGMKGIHPDHIKGALDHCRLNLEWPPSIAEFRKLCQSSSGLPDVEECMRSIIRRDFCHPIFEIIYEKIGSWAFSHDKESDLRRKINSAYKESLAELNNRIQPKLDNSTRSNVFSIVNAGTAI